MEDQPRRFTGRRAAVAVVAVGSFCTWFASFRGVGRLPVQFLLKDRLGFTPSAMASFFFVAALAFHLKPIPGLVTDRVWIRGARRLPWLAGSAIVSTVLWGLFSWMPFTTCGLLAVVVAINAMAAVGDAVTGGVLVDEERLRGGAGRLVAIREGAFSAAIVAAWLLGGWLSGRSRELLAVAGALPWLALVLATSLWLREASAPRDALSADAAIALRSGAFWRVAGVILLFAAAPGYDTLLLFHQRDVLGLSGSQIGFLRTLNGGAGMLAAAAYVQLSRRRDVGELLIGGIGVNAMSSLFYLAYRTLPLACAVEVANGFLGTLGILAIQHLAARAAPRGSEALGFSLLLGIEGFASYFSDVAGTFLAERFGLSLAALALINAGGTALALFALPALPPTLRRSGGSRR